ncbi:hypothetical protein [Paraburkholderia bryophila]|uniref:Uncharacterized protein n=1 Tax=Paraburkholderia bryophila TaxID=420952 RepID=A0A7Y9W4J0_9BURK|nr:hypothetical protein [Paraburkholderia bryophila]NYH13546.1 hypothetical protein [Paraburkholderia bryophila]
MEALRTFIVSEMKRAEAVVYEGRPLPVFRGESLPPAPDEPQTPKSGKPRTLSAEVLTEIRRRLGAGDSLTRVANALGVSVSRVFTEKERMRAEAAPAASFAVEAVPEVATPAKPTPVVLSASPEGQRLHVLDWGRRMAAWQFEGEPSQGKPKKRPKCINPLTRKQARTALGGHQRVSASAINCVDCRPPEPLASTADTEKARKKAEFDLFFVAAEGGREVEFQTGE